MLARGLEIDLVGVDRPCRALEVATGAGVATLELDREPFGGFAPTFDRSRYSERWADALSERGIDLVAMAGFGTVLSSVVARRFRGRVLNTHPSLLPAFPGWHAVAATLNAGVTETGCTVHVATERLDDGPILAQRRVTVRRDDDEASLHERIKDVERVLYPEVVGRVMAALARGDEPVSVAGQFEES